MTCVNEHKKTIFHDFWKLFPLFDFWKLFPLLTLVSDVHSTIGSLFFKKNQEFLYFVEYHP